MPHAQTGRKGKVCPHSHLLKLMVSIRSANHVPNTWLRGCVLPCFQFACCFFLCFPLGKFRSGGGSFLVSCQRRTKSPSQKNNNKHCTVLLMLFSIHPHQNGVASPGHDRICRLSCPSTGSTLHAVFPDQNGGIRSPRRSSGLPSFCLRKNALPGWAGHPDGSEADLGRFA